MYSSFEVAGAPSFDSWELEDSSAIHYFSFSHDVPPNSGNWSLRVDLDSTAEHSLTNTLNISTSTGNDFYILSYRAKCVGNANGEIWGSVLAVPYISLFFHFPNDTVWTAYSDTLAPTSPATSYSISLSVNNHSLKYTFHQLTHPVYYDSNYVLFDDFHLVRVTH